MSWKTAEPPWTLGGKYNKTSYNEGNKITSNSNPVWDYPTQGATPITTTHNPCGYWNLGSGVCGDAVISYSTAIMEVGDTQTFSVTTTVIGSSYTWEIESGLGSLSTATGNTTVFTAAAVGYTTIIMKCQGAKCSSFRVRTIEYTYTVETCWEMTRENPIRSAVHGGILYIGGNAGGVYSFDGTTVSSVGSPQAGASDPRISGLVSHGDYLFASVYAGSGVYRYNGGTSWTNVGTPGLTRTCTIYSDGTNLYAGARQVGSQGNGVYVWNGTSTWTKFGTALKIGNSDNVNAIISFNGTLIATDGRLTAYAYTGGELVSIGVINPPLTGAIVYLIEYEESLYAGKTDIYLCEYASGTTWSVATTCPDGGVWYHPAVWKDSLILSSNGGRIYAYDGSTSTLIATIPVMGTQPNIGTICVYNGDLYSASYHLTNPSQLCKIVHSY